MLLVAKSLTPPRTLEAPAGLACGASGHSPWVTGADDTPQGASQNRTCLWKLEGTYAFLMGVFLRLCFLLGCSRLRGHRGYGVRTRELKGWSASKRDVRVGHPPAVSPGRGHITRCGIRAAWGPQGSRPVKPASMLL